MADKTKRNLAQQCDTIDQMIDKQKAISDYEKSRLRKLKSEYEHKNIEAQERLVKAKIERD